jgi:hypothetical protein
MMSANRTRKPQTVKKHPDEWEKDLNPTHMQGQNVGPHSLQDFNPRTAADEKELTRSLAGFRKDELEQIPLVPPGVRLEQGAVYLDLRNPNSAPMVATGEMIAEEGELYTLKSEVPYEYWNSLLAARSGTSNSEAAFSEQSIDQSLAGSLAASGSPARTTGRGGRPANRKNSSRAKNKRRRKS